MQIHDELLFLVREDALPRATAVIRGAMQSVTNADDLWTLSVSMPVKVQVGPSWGELEEYTADL